MPSRLPFAGSRMPDEVWRRIPLDRGDAGIRLDRYSLRHLRHTGVSRTRIQRWIRGRRRAGQRAAGAARRVAPASTDDLEVCIERQRERVRPAAEPIPIEILYEDDDLLIVNKPPGLVSHPSHLNRTGTLLNGILAHARQWPAESRPGLLGRLDKQTSGLVLSRNGRRFKPRFSAPPPRSGSTRTTSPSSGAGRRHYEARLIPRRPRSVDSFRRVTVTDRGGNRRSRNTSGCLRPPGMRPTPGKSSRWCDAA